MIRLVGPGGAGKTTIGAVLAEAIGCGFVDLDAEFRARIGVYATLPSIKIETMRPPADVAADIRAQLRDNGMVVAAQVRTSA